MSAGLARGIVGHLRFGAGAKPGGLAHAIFLLQIAFGLTTASVTHAAVPLLVFAGQSNMVGYGTSYYDLAPAQQVTQPNVDFYYPTYQVSYQGVPTPPGPGWAPLTPPTEWGVANWYNLPEVGFGPEISVGQDLVNAGVYSNVAEVKAAFNGTFLGTQAEIPADAGVNANWNPATPAQSGVYGSYYRQMLGDVAAAQQSYGQATQVSAFFWMQGESDAEYASTAEAYEANLISLIAAVRASFNNPNLPFIYGRIDDQNPSAFPYAATVRAAQDAVASSIPCVYEVDTDSLPLRYDDTHYTSQGIIELGNLFASGLQNLSVGDANMDGVINAEDYTAIDNGFNMHLTGWSNGDFNSDGVVNGDDYTLIDNAYNSQGMNAFAGDSQGTMDSASETEKVASNVPEPAGLGVLAISAFLRRQPPSRQRRKRIK
jgi:Carbohydrate esterase, sialic acid-specific acetylesterase